jgi:uncharacterized protein (TIGR02118 family)
MIKTIALAYRKEGMTREEYNNYWLNKHAPLAVKLIPGVRRYVQNHFVSVPGMEYQGDGIVEMWYDDVETWKKSRDVVMASKELAQDAANFCTLGKGGGGFWLVEEHVIIDNIKKR